MRTLRKKLLRLDEKRHFWNDQETQEFYEEASDYRSEGLRKPRHKQSTEEVFRCKHCRHLVCPPPSGGRHRNHCPFCLYSRHVDDRKPGDRMSSCGSTMKPVGRFQRPNGEYVIIHQCHGCEFERFNRIAADDDFELVLSLPAQPARTSREVKAQQVEALLAEQVGQRDWEVEEAG
jgi:hypothetical protein